MMQGWGVNWFWGGMLLIDRVQMKQQEFRPYSGSNRGPRIGSRFDSVRRVWRSGGNGWKKERRMPLMPTGKEGKAGRFDGGPN